MSSVQELQDALRLQEEFIAVCDELLGFDPQDANALKDKDEAEAELSSLQAKLAAAQSASHPPPPPADHTPHPPPATTEAPLKYDMSKHPKFRNPPTDPAPPPPPPADDTPAVFNVKDQVMAKYTEDKQWYQATIITKTGSSADPVYTVTFKGYNNTETKRKHEVRPMARPAESKKRKSDGNPVTSTAPSPAPSKPATNGAVISAAPSVDPSLVQKRVPSKVSDGPTRLAPEPKKLKTNKALDKAKSSWNTWQQTGPKKAPAAGAPQPKKKESQFRTPDLPGAKVGFTGSGKPMQKDQSRAKWAYGDDDE